MRPALIIVASAMLAMGCASPPHSERWLTAEEDAALREKCEPHGGCVAVPVGVWERIEQLLRRLSGTAI